MKENCFVWVRENSPVWVRKNRTFCIKKVKKCDSPAPTPTNTPPLTKLSFLPPSHFDFINGLYCIYFIQMMVKNNFADFLSKFCNNYCLNDLIIELYFMNIL